MRATLHDELMHEAGFETDYNRELGRRRATRRRIARAVASFAVALGGFSGLLLDHGHVARSVVLVLFVLFAVGLVCGAALEWAEWRKRSRLMKALTGLVRWVTARLGRTEEGHWP